MTIQIDSAMRDPLASCDTVEIEEGIFQCHTDNPCNSALYIGPKKLCRPLSHALNDHTHRQDSRTQGEE